MNNPDEPALEDRGGRDSDKKKGRGRKGMRVATTAGIALGLTVVGAEVAGAATNGTGSQHAHPGGKYASKASNGRARPPGGTRKPGGRPGGRPGGSNGRAGARPAVVGTVATVGTDSFTVTTQGGSTVTVDVTAATTYRDPGVTSPSFADVKVGETVVAFGTETAGTVAATSIGIGTPGGLGRSG